MFHKATNTLPKSLSRNSNGGTITITDSTGKNVLNKQVTQGIQSLAELAN